ncbi:hypothetical protein BKA67DRAFT_569684 [Truncatella angustata]|uniref:Uncharacterized protein n=1 Tax=Truncatella angustata TaxID=152316 RepID=A0A9P8UJQ7_9PEZI|nr:uncharacterized protein BKA67DRAFT_569684 [Truncatella angustata]KAH6653441.1 hypothetical protein BKA67DRAFT_569684 [Truncatella angustata]
MYLLVAFFAVVYTKCSSDLFIMTASLVLLVCLEAFCFTQLILLCSVLLGKHSRVTKPRSCPRLLGVNLFFILTYMVVSAISFEFDPDHFLTWTAFVTPLESLYNLHEPAQLRLLAATSTWSMMGPLVLLPECIGIGILFRFNRVLQVVPVIFHCGWTMLWTFDSQATWYENVARWAFCLLQALSVIPLVLGFHEACIGILLGLFVLNTLYRELVVSRTIEEQFSLRSITSSSQAPTGSSDANSVRVCLLGGDFSGRDLFISSVNLQEKDWTKDDLKVPIGRNKVHSYPDPSTCKGVKWKCYELHRLVGSADQSIEIWDTCDLSYLGVELFESHWWSTLDGIILLFTPADENSLYRFHRLHDWNAFGMKHVRLASIQGRGTSSTPEEEVIERGMRMANDKGWTYIRADEFATLFKSSVAR